MARANKSGGSLSDAVSLALRIATIALSVASAAMMGSANQSTGGGGGGCGGGCAPACEVSYSDYDSFRYALAANVASAALQAVAAYLTARGSKGGGKAAKSLAELVDTASQVFLYSSSGLSFAVDDFGACGRRAAGVCGCGGAFCRRVRVSGAMSLAAGFALSASQYLKDVPITISFEGDDDDDHDDDEPSRRGRGCHCHH